MSRIIASVRPAFFVFSFFAAAYLCFPQSTRAEFVRGDINGWFTNNFMTQDATFGNIWKVTIRATNTISSSGFLFVQVTESYDPKWTRGTDAVPNTSVGTGQKNVGDDLRFGFTNGLHYSFNLAGTEVDNDRAYVIMATATNPVTIPAVNVHVSASTGVVPVAVQSSATPGASENIWVRFATNSFFSPSSLIPATGSSTNYTANLPAQPAGARAYFYVLTSTMPSNVITANYDLNTLRGKISGTTNYSFRFGTMNAWHFPTNAEPSGAFMRNPPTNGVPPETAVFFYTGSQTGGVGNAANQSGMQLVHRLKGSGTWTTNNGGFDSATTFNQYWIASITGNTYSATNEVEYYLRVTASDHNTTFIGTTNGLGNTLFLAETGAQAAPFSFTYGNAGEPIFNLGNAWHIPANAEPPAVFMRNPPYAFSNNAVYIYNGNQFQGGGNAADQSGGTLYYRMVGAGAWSSNNLSFDSQYENNKYWVGVIPSGIYNATNEIEYYLRITYSDRDTTFIGTTNNGAGSLTYGVEATAQSNPFRFVYGGEPGSEAGYMWHNSNRVVLAAGSVQFWIKIGFAQGDGDDRWVDNVRLYYTTNGAAVGVTGKGTGDANTLVQVMTFSHTEQDASPNGNAMWWSGIATNLPLAGDIRYKIGSWNGSGIQRFAEYNTDGQDNKEFVFSLFVAGADGLTINGINADYTT